MKKLIIGLGLIFTSTIFDCCIIIASAIMASELTAWYGLGKMYTSIVENKLTIPLIIVNIILIIGFIIIYKEYNNNEK